MSGYDWDPEKAIDNFAKHGVTFEEARTVGASPLSRRESDAGHSINEERAKVVGYSSLGRLLVVIVSTGGLRPRIISARRATKRERDAYTG